jgi:RNA polymerase sigma-70 factor (ECF subfamily)
MRMESSDAILVNRAQSGDAQAFGQLIERHYDMILRLGYRMLGSQSLAEDLAQDVCCALPKKLNSFRGDAKFSTWLYRVVINAAKDILRKQKTRKNAQHGWSDMFEMQQQDANEKARDRAWLAQAMKTLPVDLREILVLTLAEDLSHAEASAVLGVPMGTISWRISEAKKHLRALAQSEETYP